VVSERDGKGDQRPRCPGRAGLRGWRVRARLSSSHRSAEAPNGIPASRPARPCSRSRDTSACNPRPERPHACRVALGEPGLPGPSKRKIKCALAAAWRSPVGPQRGRRRRSPGTPAAFIEAAGEHRRSEGFEIGLARQAGVEWFRGALAASSISCEASRPPKGDLRAPACQPGRAAARRAGSCPRSRAAPCARSGAAASNFACAAASGAGLRAGAGSGVSAGRPLQERGAAAANPAAPPAARLADRSSSAAMSSSGRGAAWGLVPGPVVGIGARVGGRGEGTVGQAALGGWRCLVGRRRRTRGWRKVTRAATVSSRFGLGRGGSVSADAKISGRSPQQRRVADWLGSG